MRRLGGPAGTGRERVVGVAGVTSRLPGSANDGVMVIVPATVPVWRLISLLPPEKMASVSFGGMVNVTSRPPVANCTAGSADRPPLSTLRVNFPLISTA